LIYLEFQSFGFERTWWRLFQKRFVRTKFDIYVFIMQRSFLFQHITISTSLLDSWYTTFWNWIRSVIYFMSGIKYFKH